MCVSVCSLEDCALCNCNCALQARGSYEFATLSLDPLYSNKLEDEFKSEPAPNASEGEKLEKQLQWPKRKTVRLQQVLSIEEVNHRRPGC